MIDDEEVDVDILKEKRICVGCVTEKFLKRLIRDGGTKAACSYGHGNAKTLSVAEVAVYIEQALTDHYEPVGPDPHPFQGQDGEPVADVMADAAGIDPDTAEDVRRVLEEEHKPYDKHTMYDPNFFEENVHYQSKGVEISEYQDQWEFFRKSILTEARLFNDAAEGVLNRIFEGIADHATQHGAKVIVDAGPNGAIKSLYRARWFQDDDKLQAAIEKPHIDLGAPPPQSARAGRMNAQGIGVFYGATHSSVALAEIRPPVGSRVIIGRFDITRALALLDIGAMGSIDTKGSIFDASFVHALQKSAFLHMLSARITQPVMPDDETSEYLVTQAIADYLATRSTPWLDGIVYPSVQQRGKRKRNVVLFHKSARVAEPALPRHSRVEGSLYESDEGFRWPEYSVTIWKFPEKKDEPGRFTVPVHDLWDPSYDPRLDDREPALKIERDAVKVHHIESVKIGTHEFEVTPREYNMSDAEAERIRKETEFEF